MKKNYQNILIIFVCCILIMLPYIIAEYHNGHDTEFHVANVLAMIDQIKTGNTTDILPYIANDLGYGTRLFYPALAHSTVAFFGLILNGVSILYSFKIVQILVLFVSGVAMYFLSKKVSKNNVVAVISAVIYMCFPYHLFDIYVRDAIAECFIFIFLPIILLSLTYLFEDKKKFFFLFVIGYVGGILAHFTMMIYFTILIIPFFLINIKKIFKKDIIITLIISTIVVILITSPLLSSMIEYKLQGDYMVYFEKNMTSRLEGSAINPNEYISFIKMFEDYEARLYIDFISFILIIITSIAIRKIKVERPYIIFIIIFTLTSMYFSTILFNWSIVPDVLRMIQFPWRLEVFVAIGVSIYAPLCLQLKNKFAYLLIYGYLIFSFIGIYFPMEGAFNEANFEYNKGIGWQNEYLPVNTAKNMEYFNNRNNEINVRDTGKAYITENGMPNLKFSFEGNSRVELPRIYYFGYKLKDSNNNNVNIYENEYGFIQANLSSGEYFLVYEGTIARKITKCLSLITVITVVAYGGYVIYKKRNKILISQ